MMRSVFVSAAAVLFMAAGSFAQASNKVGVINFQSAIMGTKDGQKAEAQLEQEFTPRKKEFDSRQSEIGQLQDQLSKGGTLMSDDKRTEVAREIDEKKRHLQHDMQDAQEQLNQAEQKALGEIYQRMQAVLIKYAKDNGYTLILDDGNQQTSPILFAASAIDVTQDIIALYDKNSSNGGPISIPSLPSAAKPGTPGQK